MTDNNINKIPNNYRYDISSSAFSKKNLGNRTPLSKKKFDDKGPEHGTQLNHTANAAQLLSADEVLSARFTSVGDINEPVAAQQLESTYIVRNSSSKEEENVIDLII